METKPIETKYDGCLFRSRLEARWAVFFNALGLEWKYEREGYELEDGTRYLPDFWFDLDEGVYFSGWGFYVEIKPYEPTPDERQKLYLLAKGTGHTVMCFWGFPCEEEWHIAVYKGQQEGKCLIEDGKISMNLMTIVSTKPILLENGKIAWQSHHLPFGAQWQRIPDDIAQARMTLAFVAAKSARFEFGDQG